MSELLIRDFRPNDVEALCRLTIELGYPTTADEMKQRMNCILQNPDYKTILATSQTEVLGYIGMFKCLFWEQNGCYIKVQSLVVSSSARRQGIGETLLEEAEKWGRAIGAKLITLNSGNRAERFAAHQFYPAQGYEAKSTGYVKLIDP
ncbi:MAG: GNAT family N-acetyltransferase [Bacteroidota bacterium]